MSYFLTCLIRLADIVINLLTLQWSGLFFGNLQFDPILHHLRHPLIEVDHLIRESISISRERHPEELKEGTQRLFSDISYGHFHRAAKLPIAIQNTEVEASFEQGILILTLPKVETEQNKVVKVNLLSDSSNETSQTALEASHTPENS